MTTSPIPCPVMKRSTKLESGDVFEFEGRRYVHVFGYHYIRHVSVWVMAMTEEDYDQRRVDHDVVFQFDTETELKVVGHRQRSRDEVIHVYRGERQVGNEWRTAGEKESAEL